MTGTTPAEPSVRCLSGVVTERSRSELPGVTSVALRSAQPPLRLSVGRFDRPPDRRFVMAKWVVAGRAVIGVQGSRRPFGPGDLALHLPDTPHAFWVVDEGTAMCWFSVDGPLAEQFVTGLGLHSGVYRYGSAPEPQIREMAEALRNHTIQGRRRASLLAVGLLYEIANRVCVGADDVPSVVRLAQRLIHEEFADPNLSIAGLADRLDYHRGALSRLFHQTTGVTLIDYLTQVRLQEARMLLLRTPDKVMNIARKAGFRSPIYFCRWIRKHTGMTPEELRRAPLA